MNRLMSKCKSCIWQTADTCMYCRAWTCHKCKVIGLCSDCDSDPNVPKIVRGRLHSKRKRPAPTEPVMQHTPPQPRPLSPPSIPVTPPQQLSTSSCHSVSQSTQSLPQRRTQDKPCECCQNIVRQLKLHLLGDDECFGYYKTEYSVETIQGVMKKINEKLRVQRRKNQKIMGIKRERGEDINRQRLRRQDGSIRKAKNEYKMSMARILEIPCIICTCRFSAGVDKVAADTNTIFMMAGYESRLETMKYKGDHYICKNCSKIQSKLLHNSNLVTAVNAILNGVNDNEEVVGILKYKTGEELNTVYVPLITAGVELGFNSESLPHNRDTAMIQHLYSKLDSNSEVSVEESSLLSNQDKVEIQKLLACLYKDTNKKLKSAKLLMENSGVEIGFIEGNKLYKLDDKKENLEKYMNNIRCTEAYQTRLVKENFDKQRANGRFNLYINIELFGGELWDPALAKLLLKNRNIDVQVVTKKKEDGVEVLEFVIPCDLGEYKHCDVRVCNEVHESAIDKAKQFYDDGIPEDEIMSVCKYLDRSANLYVNKIIKKEASEHDLKLVFGRNGFVYLRGIIWVEQLEEANRTGDETNTEDISSFARMIGAEVRSEIVELSAFPHEDPTSKETEENLDAGLACKLREGSVFEMVYQSCRGLTSHWSSQGVARINVGNWVSEGIIYFIKTLKDSIVA